MNNQAAFKDCLERLDITLMRKLWQHVAPHLPQPKTDEETLVTMHIARTEAKSLMFKFRAYSHSWLLERNYPSRLPDRLKKSADKMYPRIVEAVGISVNMRSPFLAPIKAQVQRAMENSVLESQADGLSLSDPLVRTRMLEAKDATMQKLMGNYELGKKESGQG